MWALRDELGVCCQAREVSGSTSRSLQFSSWMRGATSGSTAAWFEGSSQPILNLNCGCFSHGSTDIDAFFVGLAPLQLLCVSLHSANSHCLLSCFAADALTKRFRPMCPHRQPPQADTGLACSDCLGWGAHNFQAWWLQRWEPITGRRWAGV